MWRLQGWIACRLRVGPLFTLAWCCPRGVESTWRRLLCLSLSLYCGCFPGSPSRLSEPLGSCSSLCLGSGVLSFWGSGGGSCCRVHTDLPGPLQEKGSSHSEGSVLQERGDALIPLKPRLLDPLVLSLLLPSWCEWRSGEPQEKNRCKHTPHPPRLACRAWGAWRGRQQSEPCTER